MLKNAEKSISVILCAVLLFILPISTSADEDIYTVILQQGSPVVTLLNGQPYSEGGNYGGAEDTYINTVQSNNNFGGHTDQFLVGGNTGNGKYRAFLRFNLPDLPAGAEILSASLELSQYERASSAPGNYINLYSVIPQNAGWIEGGGGGTNGTPQSASADGSSWNNKSYGNQWSDGSGGYAAGAGTTTAREGAEAESFLTYPYIASSQVPSANVATHSFTFNAEGVDAVNGWLSDDNDGNPDTVNPGLMLTGYEGNAACYTRFRTSENAALSTRPKLTLTYRITENGEPGIIERVNLNTPANLNQYYGAIEQVDFTAIPVPRNSDPETVEWYVNGVQRTVEDEEGQIIPFTGLNFSYTPPNAVGEYLVTAKVTGNLGAVCDTRTITVSAPAMPESVNVYADDDFESYTAGNTVTSSAWGWSVSGTTAVLFPEDADPPTESDGANKAAKFTGTNYLRKHVSLTVPTVVRGKILMTGDTAQSYSLSIRDSTTSGFRIFYFRYTQNTYRIEMSNGVNGDSNSVLATYTPGEWVWFEMIIIPDNRNPQNTVIRCNVWGEGVTPNPSWTGSKQMTKWPAALGLSDVIFNFERLGGGTAAHYADDIYIATAPEFVINISQNKNITGAVTLTFNEPVDPVTLTQERITVKKEGSDAALTVDTLNFANDNKSVEITFLETLGVDAVYKLSLSPDVRNIYGCKPYNVTFFTTGNGEPPPRIPDVKVSAINISPESLTLWEDFPFPAQLASEVLPGNAANAALEWISSNENAVTVDNTGTLTITGQGTAAVIARAIDGSGAESAECVITVTPPKNRAENQKLNLDSSFTDSVPAAVRLSWPENIGEGVVAMWDGDRKGAYSITVDDGIEADYDTWLNWAEEYGLTFTFFVPLSGVKAGLADEQKLWAAGQDIQSHTRKHLDTAHQQAQKTAEVIDDYAKPVEVINAANPAANVKTVAYSYGYSGNSPYSRLYHIAARGVSGMANQGGRTNYNNVGSHSMNGTVPVVYANPSNGGGQGNSWSMEGSVKALYDTDYKLFGGTSYYGGWTSLHSHGLSTDGNNPDISVIDKNGSGKANTYEVLDYTFQNYLYPAIESGNIWQDSFTNVAMYAQERDSSNLTVTPYENKITYTLTDQMDDAVFDYPLTVKLKVDPSWNGITAKQGDTGLDVTVVYEDGNKYVLIKSRPDCGLVTVEPAEDAFFEDNGVKITNPSLNSESGRTVFTANFELEESVKITAYLIKYTSGGKILADVDLTELETTSPVLLEISEVSDNEEIYLLIWDGFLRPQAHKIDLIGLNNSQ